MEEKTGRMIGVRRMEVPDLDAVMRLEKEIPAASHWSRSAYESYVAPQAAVQSVGFVAEAAGALAGFVMVRLVAGICELESIAVGENARRKGTGGALLRNALAWAAENGGVRMELEARAANITAVRFYEKAGFVRDGVRTGYYANPVDDAVLMSVGVPQAASAEE